MCVYIDKLEELTLNLPQTPLLSDFKSVDGDQTLYNLEGGTAVSDCLYSVPDVAIAKTFIPKGALFNEHIHNNNEWVIVLDGSLNVKVGGETIILNKYDSIKFNKEVPHSALAEEDTTIIAITVPRDDGFPE